LVTVGGVAGYLFSQVVENPEAPAYLFLVELPPTPAGFVVYGALTIATVLGIPLLLIVVISERYDVESPAQKD
jgi:hypothetical protein